MKIESKLVVRKNNGYDYIYVLYEQNKCRLRVNTRMQYVKGKMTKENLFNNKMAKYESLNKEIFKIKMNVDSYIKASLNTSLTAVDVYFSQDGYKTWIKQQHDIKTNFSRNKPKLLKTVLDYYIDFLEHKEEHSDMKTISFKNYISLKNFINDYRFYSGETLYLFDIDAALINKFVAFAEIDLKELNKSRKKQGLYTFKTHGNLQDVTLRKRLENFREFCEYLNEYEDTNIKVKRIFPKITKYNKKIIYIDENEYNEIVKIRDLVVNKLEKKVIDSFIFNYRAGLRFEDLTHLCIDDFEEINEGYILIKELNKGSKHNSLAQIPIVHPLIVKIIEDYDFHFEFKHNGTYNKILHKIFERFDLLNTPITIKKTFYKKKNEIIKTNPKDESKPLLKRDIITSHTNRRSLITLALTRGYTFTEVMNMTGHRNVKTVQIYNDSENKELLNINLKKRLEEIKK